MSQTPIASHLTTAVLDPILETTVGACTRDQLLVILDALGRVPGGNASPSSATINTLLP